MIGAAALLAGAGLAAWSFAVTARPQGSHERSGIARPPSEHPTAEFRLEGEYWTIAFRGPTFRLVDSKGLQYIHRLLRAAGTEVHALDLELQAAPGAAAGRAQGDDLHPDASTQLLVDHETLRRYRLKVEDLRDQIEEAEANNDPERASRAREELEYLVDELDRVTRSDGSPRAQPGETERARVNVYRAIRKAIDKIREQDPSLGHHLDHDIRTGTYCSYAPDPSTAPDWSL